MTWLHKQTHFYPEHITSGKHSATEQQRHCLPFPNINNLFIDTVTVMPTALWPCVLFCTINLLLFTLVKITHPDTWREGLMTPPAWRLVWSAEVDDGHLMWWLLSRSLCFHFSSVWLSVVSLSFCFYPLTSSPLRQSAFLLSPHAAFFSYNAFSHTLRCKQSITPAVLSIFWHLSQSSRNRNYTWRQQWRCFSPCFSSLFLSLYSFTLPFSLSIPFHCLGLHILIQVQSLKNCDTFSLYFLFLRP